jgi:hypothetical protein
MSDSIFTLSSRYSPSSTNLTVLQENRSTEQAIIIRQREAPAIKCNTLFMAANVVQNKENRLHLFANKEYIC